MVKIRGSFLRRGERAQTTAEFVVVFPMLLLLFFLMLEFGWLFKNWVIVTNTPREAARCAVANACGVDGMGNPLTPTELLMARLRSGVTGNLDINGDGDVEIGEDVTVDIHYIEVDGDTGPTSGDSLVVCVLAGNKAITPLLAFASMAGVLSDPIPIAAREEMLIEVELDPAWAIPQGDATCTS